MTCLEKPFMWTYLRPKDKSNLLVREVFNSSEKMVSRVSILSSENADKILESLHFDDNNLSGTLNIENRGSHVIYLNYHSKLTRGKSKEKLMTELQEKLFKMKEAVEKNMISNLQDQNSETPWYWDCSGLDITISLSLDNYIARLLEIMSLYNRVSPYKSKIFK